MKERTLSLLKPDVVPNKMGSIIQHLTDKGLRIIAMKLVYLTPEAAKQFYYIHRTRPFYTDLVKFMSSGPIVAMVLEGENAVLKNREIMGETDSKKAAMGTIRHTHGTNIERNAVHGSDSLENARTEIAFFFSEAELIALHSESSHS